MNPPQSSKASIKQVLIGVSTMWSTCLLARCQHHDLSVCLLGVSTMWPTCLLPSYCQAKKHHALQMIHMILWKVGIYITKKNWNNLLKLITNLLTGDLPYFGGKLGSFYCEICIFFEYALWQNKLTRPIDILVYFVWLPQLPPPHKYQMDTHIKHVNLVLTIFWDVCTKKTLKTLL